jgi:hypothetical protein
MNTESGQNVDAMDRPAVFMGMGDGDLAEMDAWLGVSASGQDPDSTISTPSYQRGVYFCLGQVGIGFTAIAGADIIDTWRDRQGSVWTWNDDAMEPKCDAMRPRGQVDDLLELPHEEFTAFAQGMLDAAAACGWDGRA